MDNKIEKYSPDNKYKLVFFDFEEPKMGANICKFYLIDLSENLRIEFPSINAMGYGNWISWSENSRYFSLPLDNRIECFFIYNTKEKRFALIPFKNCAVLEDHLFDESIEIEYREEQIPERIEHSKYPTKEYSKPGNLIFKFQDLEWVLINRITEIDTIISNYRVYDLKPIDNGWRIFKGELPKTTDILIWELNEFARYGDSQSKEWLEEIKKNTKNLDYWVKASKYLGYQTRKYQVGLN